MKAQYSVRKVELLTNAFLAGMCVHVPYYLVKFAISVQGSNLHAMRIWPSSEHKRSRKALLVTVGSVDGGWRNRPISFMFRTRLC